MSLTSPASLLPRIRPALAALSILLLTFAVLATAAPVSAAEPRVVRVRSVGAESSAPTTDDNDFTRLLRAFEEVATLQRLAGESVTLEIEGVFDWREANAFESWCAGSDGEEGGADDWALTPPIMDGLRVVGVGAVDGYGAKIVGPGDLEVADQGTVLRLSGGQFHDWTIENLYVTGFEVGIRCEADVNDPHPCTGLILRGNRIDLPADRSDAVLDPSGNVGALLGPGVNQLIENNLLVLDGSGTMDSGNGGRAWVDGLRFEGNDPAAFEGLVVRDNVFHIVGVPHQDPQEVVAIRDAAGANASTILIEGNVVRGEAGEHTPADSLWIGVEVGSHSSDETAVSYLGNHFVGLRYGMRWSGEEDTLPAPGEPAATLVEGNRFEGNDIGLHARSSSSYHFEHLTLRYNAFVGNGLAVLGEQTHVELHANWWGCNDGPGAPGCDDLQVESGERPEFDWTWLTLTASLTPGLLEVGQSASLTASLRVDSNGVDHGAIPVAQGEPVAFTAMRNSLTPAIGTLDLGLAVASFATLEAGVDRIRVEFDGAAIELVVPVTTLEGVLPVVAVAAEPTTPTATDNDFTRIQEALAAAVDGLVIELAGTFDWTEPHAAAARAAGRDGLAGSDDDFAAEPATASNVTLRGGAAGATVLGGGDLESSSWDGFLRLPATATSWTVEGLELLDFEIGILLAECDADGCGSGHVVRDNRIRVAAEHEGGDSPNVAIYAGSDDHLQVFGNEIELVVSAHAVADYGAALIGIWTFQGDEGESVGPVIRGNAIRVTGTPAEEDPAPVYGLLEEAYRVGLAAMVEDNTLSDETTGALPSAGLWITSQSAPEETYRIAGNQIAGFAVGVGNWEGWQEVPEPQPIELVSNHLRDNGRGFHFTSSSQPVAYRLRFNRIAGNAVGLEAEGEVTVDAARNWWGCNGGPGAVAAGCAASGDSAAGADLVAPWLTLEIAPASLEVAVEGTVPFSATVVRDSEGGDTSSLGSLADGTQIALSATGGTVTPELALTAGGSASASYTAGTSTGSYGIWATLDGQTVAAAVEVAEAFADLSMSASTARRIHNDGDPFLLELVVVNEGTTTVSGGAVAVTLPPVIEPAGWTCEASAGGTCSPQGGAGAVDSALVLPPGGIALYRLTGTVEASQPGTAWVVATAILPPGMEDGNPDNSTAEVELILGGLFSDDFESGDTTEWDTVAAPLP